MPDSTVAPKPFGRQLWIIGLMAAAPHGSGRPDDEQVVDG
jgi:hypothetical protein